MPRKNHIVNPKKALLFILTYFCDDQLPLIRKANAIIDGLKEGKAYKIGTFHFRPKLSHK